MGQKAALEKWRVEEQVVVAVVVACGFNDAKSEAHSGLKKFKMIQNDWTSFKEDEYP